MTIIHGEPPPDAAVYLDEHHAYVPVNFEGKPAGITEYHWTGEHWCAGFVAFRDYSPDHGWDVLSTEPLTLSPSLLCRLCGSHGFIRDGKWVGA
jgi:hypothetical protein